MIIVNSMQLYSHPSVCVNNWVCICRCR